MINPEVIKSKVISFIERNGPSLPIQIAKELGMNSIFASAFLSELLDAKKIKNSSVRVGGTYLYLIPGQEPQLERFHNFLHPKEVEAYNLLKENKVLKDSEQEPAIRVALRAIKDFAFSFKNDDEIFWRYLTVTEPEIIDIFNRKKSEKKQIETKKPEQEIITVIERIEESIENIEEKPRIKPKEKHIEIIKKPKVQEQNEFINPLAEKPVEKPKKEKPKSEFVLEVMGFIEKNKWTILEEKEFKAKEYNCVVEIETELGPIAFLTQAKDKKSVSDSDLNLLLKQAQAIPLPALFLSPGNLTKKAQEYQKKYYSILKTSKIE